MKKKEEKCIISGVCIYLGRKTFIPTWGWRILFLLTPAISMFAYFFIWIQIPYKETKDIKHFLED